jgi:hypothetical protein
MKEKLSLEKKKMTGNRKQYINYSSYYNLKMLYIYIYAPPFSLTIMLLEMAGRFAFASLPMSSSKELNVSM